MNRRGTCCTSTHHQQRTIKQQSRSTNISPKSTLLNWITILVCSLLLICHTDLRNLLLPAMVVVDAATPTTTTTTTIPAVPATCAQYAMPLTLKGKKFFQNSDGMYIPLKGINYYPRPNSGTYTLTNSQDFYSADFQSLWSRDIENFKKLNINAIRIYAVNPGLNHDLFMCALKSAGIYVIVGLAADCLDCAIAALPAPTCYSAALRSRGEFIIKTFSKYDNVIGFDAGNEISLAVANEFVNGPCQKQFIRDMRAYVKRCTSTNTMRHIPIGLASADVDRVNKALYYNCRSDPDDELENAEYFGMNVYLHCTGNLQSIDEIVGFTTLLEDFRTFQLNIPVILTEYGCISPSFPANGTYQAQRDWLQVDALFNEQYAEEFAGGFVFEYNTELVNSVAPFPFTEYGAGNFGIGYFSPIECDDTNVTCAYVPMPQFDTLSRRYGAVTMDSGPSIGSYVPPDRAYPQCPTGFAPLSSFTWPESEEVIECPEDLTVVCPDLPWECNTPTHPKPTSPTVPVSSPVKPPVSSIGTEASSTFRPTPALLSTNSSSSATTTFPTTTSLSQRTVTPTTIIIQSPSTRPTFQSKSVTNSPSDVGTTTNDGSFTPTPTVRTTTDLPTPVDAILSLTPTQTLTTTTTTTNSPFVIRSEQTLPTRSGTNGSKNPTDDNLTPQDESGAIMVTIQDLRTIILCSSAFVYAFVHIILI